MVSASAPAPRPHLEAVLALEVALQVVIFGEGLMAKAALVRAGTRVQVEVILQVIAVQEAGGAVRAGIGPLTRVFPHMDLQLVVPAQKDTEKRLKLKSWSSRAVAQLCMQKVTSLTHAHLQLKVLKWQVMRKNPAYSLGHGQSLSARLDNAVCKAPTCQGERTGAQCLSTWLTCQGAGNKTTSRLQGSQVAGDVKGPSPV